MSALNDWNRVSREYLAQIQGTDYTGAFVQRIDDLAFLTDTLDEGSGIGTVSLNLAKNFSDYIDVTVYCVDNLCSRKVVKELARHGVSVETVEPGGSILEKKRSVTEIANQIEREGYDHVHCHGLYMPLAGWKADTEYSVAFHGHVTLKEEILDRPVSWCKWYLQLLPPLSSAKEVFAISDYVNSQLKRLYGVEGVTVRNGAALERFRTVEKDLRDRYEISESAKVYGTLSGSQHYKDKEAVVQRFAEESEDGDCLVVGGSCHSRKNLEKLAKSLGVFDRTLFTDFVDEEEKPEFYNTIDVFIYTSNWEGFGLTPVEADAAGCDVKLCDEPYARELSSLINAEVAYS